MPFLIAFPLLAGLVMVQSAIISRIPLLQGTPDLVLLAIAAWALQRPVKTHWAWAILGGMMMGVASNMPFGLYLAGYVITTGMVLLLRRIVWKVPILALLTAVLAGALLIHGLSLAVLWVNGASLSLSDAFNRIILPSVVLNLLLAGPMYIVISELALWVHPEEEAESV